MNNFEKYKQLIIKIGLPLIVLGILIFIVISGSSSSKETTDKNQDASLSLFSEDELVATRYTDSVEEKLNFAVNNQDDIKEDNEKMKDEIKALKELILKKEEVEVSPQKETNLYNSFPNPNSTIDLNNNIPIINTTPKIIYKVMGQPNSTNEIDTNFGKVKKKKQIIDQKVKNKLYIPTTSISTGTLLHGLNAPTSMNRPMPTVVMIKDIAFLPNRKQMNIKECNLLVEGYGQLSDERAYFKFTKFVCINENGSKIYDTEASGYLTSLVDNKQGLPGHVVSKQNEMLKRMFIAGLFEGASEMFKDSGSTQMASALGTTTTQSNSSIDKAKNIMGGGLSTASESAKQLYLDKAKNISETVEILAQDVGLVFTDGLLLEPIDLKEQKKGKDDEKIN